MNPREPFATDAMNWLFRASWQAAILVLVVLALRRILGRRLSPRWRYGLWWIVLLRLVIPPFALPDLPDLPWPGGTEAVTNEAAPENDHEARLAAAFTHALREPPPPLPDAPLVAAPTVAPEPVVARTETSVGGATPPPPVARAAATPSVPTPAEGPARQLFLLAAWLAGALALAAWSITRERRLQVRLEREPLVDDPSVLDLIERCRRQSGVRRPVEAIRTTTVGVPALFGLVHPRLLLPRDMLRVLTPDQLRDVVLHEMEHLRHHDVAWNWVLQMVLCLHWLNPFVWVAMSRLRCDRETVRDLGVLGKRPDRSRRDYGRTILRVVESSARARARPPLVAILENRTDVKRRITMIARHDGNARRGWMVGGALTLGLTLVVALVAGLPAGPAAAAPARSKSDDLAVAKLAPRPWVLVTGYQVSGDLFAEESRLDHAMEVVTESILADRFQTVSLGMLEEACRRHGSTVKDLPSDPDLRLAVSKELSVARCLTGWAVSFGKRIVIIVEIIDPERGLPGTVHRVQCDGVTGIPDAIEGLLGRTGVLDAKAIAAAAETTARGPQDLRPVFEKIPADDLLDLYPNEARLKLEKMRSSGADWAGPEQHAEATRLLENVIAHMTRLHEDRAYRDEYVVRLNVRKHPVYSMFDYRVVSRAPYLVFVEKPDVAGAAPAAEVYGDTLARLHDEFRRLLARPLGLPDLARRGRPGEGIMKVFVFTNHASFQKYQRSIGVPLPPGVGSIYSPRDRWVTLVVSRIARERPEQADLALRKLVHEGTHQLMHVYAKVTIEKERGTEVLWTSPEVFSQRLWLQEGLAELMAGAMGSGTGPWNLASPHSQRLAELRSTRERDLPDWSLAELLSFSGTGSMLRQARAKNLRPQDQGRMSSLAYAQAWAFVHFLWNHEDGEYRDKLLAALRGELTGKSSVEEWRRIWGMTKENGDWTALEEEWRGDVAVLTR